MIIMTLNNLYSAGQNYLLPLENMIKDSCKKEICINWSYLGGK